MATQFTPVAFEDGVDDWTIRYQEGSTAAFFSDVTKIDFQGHGVMAENATQRRFFPYANVAYVLQSI